MCAGAMMCMPNDAIQHVFGKLSHADLCKVKQVSCEARNLAGEVAKYKYKNTFHAGATMVYGRCRRAGRFIDFFSGTVRILKRTGKTVDVEHTDTRTGKTTCGRKRLKIDCKSGYVPVFNLGNLGVKYGANYMDIRADDDNWMASD
jgi:hypothetical protein